MELAQGKEPEDHARAVPTPDSGLRVLSCSECTVAPPPEGRGLAVTQGRLRKQDWG